MWQFWWQLGSWILLKVNADSRGNIQLILFGSQTGYFRQFRSVAGVIFGTASMPVGVKPKFSKTLAVGILAELKVSIVVLRGFGGFFGISGNKAILTISAESLQITTVPLEYGRIHTRSHKAKLLQKSNFLYRPHAFFRVSEPSQQCVGAHGDNPLGYKLCNIPCASLFDAENLWRDVTNVGFFLTLLALK